MNIDTFAGCGKGQELDAPEKGGEWKERWRNVSGKQQEMEKKNESEDGREMVQKEVQRTIEEWMEIIVNCARK